MVKPTTNYVGPDALVLTGEYRSRFLRRFGLPSQTQVPRQQTLVILRVCDFFRVFDCSAEL